MKNVTEQTDKMLHRIAGPSAAESKPMVLSGLADRLSIKILLGYTEPSMFAHSKKRSWVTDCLQPAYFRNRGTDEKQAQVTLFLRAFLVRDLHHANVFFSKLSALFLQVIL